MARPREQDVKRNADETYPGITGLVVCRVTPRTPIGTLEASDYCQIAVKRRGEVLRQFAGVAAPTLPTGRTRRPAGSGRHG